MPQQKVTNHLSDSFTADNLIIYRNGEPGPGGAYHEYSVVDATNHDNLNVPDTELLMISFQKGARKEVGVNGVLEGTLIQIVLDRLNAFQAGEYRCRENALVITKLEEAMLWIKARELERVSRNVLGTMNK